MMLILKEIALCAIEGSGIENITEVEVLNSNLFHKGLVTRYRLQMTKVIWPIRQHEMIIDLNIYVANVTIL